MRIEVTWSDGDTTVETGFNPCLACSDFTAEDFFRYLCKLASWDKSQPQPVSYKEVQSNG